MGVVLVNLSTMSEVMIRGIYPKLRIRSNMIEKILLWVPDMFDGGDEIVFFKNNCKKRRFVKQQMPKQKLRLYKYKLG